MCSYAAVAVATLVIGVATTAYTYYDTDQNVKAQNRINQAQAEEGAALAAESFKQQAGAVRLRESEEAEAATLEKFENRKQAAQARATARVSSGEAGVSGVSVDQLIQDFHRQELNFETGTNRNLELANSQSEQDLKGLRSGAIDRVIGTRRAPTQRPSYLAAGLDVANQSLSTYQRYRYTSSTPSGRTGG